MAVFLFGIMLVVGLLPMTVGAAQEEGTVAFRFAFGALVGAEGERKLEPITGDRVLNTGDRVKMMVEMEKECYVYVIYSGTQDQVKLLFPYTLAQLNTDYQPAKRYYIPQGPAWFELDQNIGTEVFHVIASPQRLKGLEATLTQYDSSEEANKPSIAKQILAEIRELRKQNRQLTTTAERPINIGGNVRGLERPVGNDGPDVATIAQDITAGGFYSRTFSIEHR